MKTISELRNRHEGADFYVIGSGVSLEFYDPEFFRDRLTIAINWVADRRPLPARYTLTKYHDCAVTLANKYPDMTVVASRHQSGNPRTGELLAEFPNLYVFDTKDNQIPGSDFSVARDWPTNPDHLVNSHSSIASGMHLAAFLGAKTIFMVAHDTGTLDGRLHFEGYRLTPDTMSGGWMVEFEAQSRAVKARLQELYGCRIYGLLPFISPRMEGHEFR